MPRHTLYMENSIKKLFSRISARDVVISLMCFMLSRARLLGALTPFGMAFFAASFSHTGWFYAMLAAIISVPTVQPGMDSVRYVITLGFTAAVLGLSDNRHKTIFKALAVSLIYFLVCLLMQTAYGFSLYDFIVQSFESFLCFVGVYAISSVAPVITAYPRRTFLSHSEIIGIISLAAMTVMSLGSIPDIFGLNPASFVSLFLIMAVSYKGDIMISSSSGIILGLALALSTDGPASLVGAYAIAGFAAGFFSRYSRLGIVLGVTLANAVITAFMNDTSFMLINPIEVLLAGLIFATMPQKTVNIFTDFAKKAADVSSVASAQAERVSLMREERLESMAQSFKKIADIYRKDCYLRQPGKQYTTRLFDYAAEKSCTACVRRFDCWQKSRKTTLAYMNSMLSKAASKGILTTEDLPKSFADSCIKKEEFTKNFNFVYDIYKTDKLWLEKMLETRLLIVNQMEGISKILEKTAKEGGLTNDPEYEMKLKSALDSNEISTEEINVLLKNDGLWKIRIITEQQTDMEILLKTAAEVTDMKLRSCGYYPTDRGMCHELCPAGEYIIQWSSVFAGKEGEEVCGDSFVSLSLDNEAVMAISDGMGSGKSAHIQSKDTLEMLTGFLEAGFDAKTSFDLINSSLLLRSAKDCFSTIDMMSVDLYTGEIRLSKIGAAPTYIKQQEKIQRIDCCTLPIGILRDVDAETVQLGAGEHTTVVMMSDGISNTVIKTNEDWISGEISRLNTHNPAVVAERILEKAISKSGGKVEDDMTVTVAVVYKNEYKGKNYIY